MEDAAIKNEPAQTDEVNLEDAANELEDLPVMYKIIPSTPRAPTQQNPCSTSQCFIKCESIAYEVVDEEVGDNAIKEETREEPQNNEDVTVVISDEEENDQSASNEPENAEENDQSASNEPENAEEKCDSDAEENNSDDDQIAEPKEHDDEDVDPSDKFSDHPYKDLLINFKPSAYALSPPPKYKVGLMNKTPCLLVYTKIFLEELCEQLMLEMEIGVAAKFSSTSYKPILCYILVSTKKKNYLIDCLKLEDSLHLLNEVFTSLNVIKVVHDLKHVVPLQQHNLWFVNIFDLQAASRRLRWKESYWGYIGRQYNVKSDFNLNLGNWQNRPLSETYRRHAIMYMHYLIQLYYELKQKLIDAGRLEGVLQSCNRKCALRFNPDKSLDRMFHELRYMPANQVAVLHKLDEWRHSVAQQKNRSIYLVLRNLEMLQLAKQMSTKVVDIIGTAQSVHVENNVNEIQKIIKSCLKVIGPVAERRKPKHESESVTKPATGKQAAGFTKPKQFFKNKQAAEFGKPFQPFKNKQSPGFAKPQPFKNTHAPGFSKPQPFKNKQAGGFSRPQPFKNTQTGGFSRPQPFENTQAGGFSRPQPFQQAHCGASRSESEPFRKPQDDRFGNRRDNRFENGGNRKRGRWDGGPSPKKPKTSPWSSQPQWSRGRSPSPQRQASGSSPPPSYVILSNKGEAIPLEGANVLASLFSNAQRENYVDDRRGNDSSAWDARNRSSQSTNNSMNSISTLLNLSSALMNLNNLNTAGRNPMDFSALRADQRSTETYKRDYDDWPNNTDSRWKNNGGSARSVAAPPTVDHPDDSASRNHRGSTRFMAEYPDDSVSQNHRRSRSPNMVSFDNVSGNHRGSTQFMVDYPDDSASRNHRRSRSPNMVSFDNVSGNHRGSTQSMVDYPDDSASRNHNRPQSPDMASFLKSQSTRMMVYDRSQGNKMMFSNHASSSYRNW